MLRNNFHLRKGQSNNKTTIIFIHNQLLSLHIANFKQKTF